MTQYSWSDSTSDSAFPISKAGYPFIFVSAFATAVFALIEFETLAFTGLLITLFICYFFRDPDRVIPNGEEFIVSPADGKVISVDKTSDCEYMQGHCQKISIFMSVFNVHVNRVPYGGKIVKTVYHPGKFIAANKDKASKDNEQNAVILHTPHGRQICFVQIAGLVARRIICRVQKGDDVNRGQRFGLICFGSRLDVYLPLDINVKTSVGDRVQAGTSILGEMNNDKKEEV